MATCSSTEDEDKCIGDMFAVNPKKDCPHVQFLVAGIENVSIDISLPCGVCQDKSENWLCLKCSEVYCSRYVEKHMVHHNTQNPTHEIALSFSDLSFWCYACDSYIDSPHLVSILQAATMAIDVHVSSQKLKSEAHPQASGESSDKDQQTMAEEFSDHQGSAESSDKDPQATAEESSDHQGSAVQSSDKDPQTTAEESSDHQGSAESSDKDPQATAEESSDHQGSAVQSSDKDPQTTAEESSDHQGSAESSDKDPQATAEESSDHQGSAESSDKDPQATAEESSDHQGSAESSDKDPQATAEESSDHQGSAESSDKDPQATAEESSDHQGSAESPDKDPQATAEESSDHQGSAESSDKDPQATAEESSDHQGSAESPDKDPQAPAEESSDHQGSAESSDKDPQATAEESSDHQGSAKSPDKDPQATAEESSDHQGSAESSDKDPQATAEESSDHQGSAESPDKDPQATAEESSDHQGSAESSVKDQKTGAEDPSEPQTTEESSGQKVPFRLESSLEKEVLLNRIRATIYGNCIGDAIGLLTEFMTKQEAQEIYGTVTEKRYWGLKYSRKHVPIESLKLEYDMKYNDFHRSRWEEGDWTDDSDQMILILKTLLDHNGNADILGFVQKFKVWTETGYKELGDYGAMGIGRTTFQVIMQKGFFTDPHKEWVLNGYKELGDQKGHGLGGLTKSVLSHIRFLNEPIKCAYQVWDESGRWAAPNGGVMRTSILGIQDFSDIPTVIHNTRQICKVTHADPRCIASCVAVTTAIALMLQGKHCKGHGYDEQAICKEAYKNACEELQTEEEKEELHRHMFAETLSELELSDTNKIGYTYKCLGAGFWAYRQKDFRLALTELVMEAGDADTNGAVAGALLGCKLGVEYFPETWLNGLLHKDWLDPQIDRYLVMLGLEEPMQQEDRELASKQSPEKGPGAKEPQTSEESSDQEAPFHLESSLEKEVLLSRMRATIYGNCIGDAIGLLTEFMTKQEAQEIYGTVEKKSKQVPIKKLELEYNMRYNDRHRSRWKVGDWTDDSDQMILILRMLLDHSGKADILDFVQKFKVWTKTGYKELGDSGGMGIGQTTFQVTSQRKFLTDPHECAYQVWDKSGRWAAPNGGVMRTSILGIQDFSDIPTVIHNTRQICKVTHADPRCIASCVAVTTAIALMLQGKHCKGHGYDEKAICKEAYKNACEELETEEEKEELHRHMFAKSLSELELSDNNKIGYTYKCLGAGFWAYRQKDFRLALTELVMEAGDADTNGAVAGALLGCKLGVEYLPDTWLNGLLHKDWLDPQIDRYLVMLGLEEPM